MPFYEYQCKNCGHALEAMQKISDAPLKKCPHCGKSQLQRLMSAPVFRLKGGGWYETDFKGDQDNKRNLADRPEADAPKEAGQGCRQRRREGRRARTARARRPTARTPRTCGRSGRQGRGAQGQAGRQSGRSIGDKAGGQAAGGVREEDRCWSGSGGKSSARPHTAGRGKPRATRPIKPAPVRLRQSAAASQAAGP